MKHEPHSRFEMKVLGEASMILGVKLFCHQGSRKLLVSGERHDICILDRFGIETALSAFIPIQEPREADDRLERKTNDICD